MSPTRRSGDALRDLPEKRGKAPAVKKKALATKEKPAAAKTKTASSSVKPAKVSAKPTVPKTELKPKVLPPVKPPAVEKSPPPRTPRIEVIKKSDVQKRKEEEAAREIALKKSLEKDALARETALKEVAQKTAPGDEILKSAGGSGTPPNDTQPGRGSGTASPYGGPGMLPKEPPQIKPVTPDVSPEAKPKIEQPQTERSGDTLRDLPAAEIKPKDTPLPPKASVPIWGTPRRDKSKSRAVPEVKGPKENRIPEPQKGKAKTRKNDQIVPNEAQRGRPTGSAASGTAVAEESEVSVLPSDLPLQIQKIKVSFPVTLGELAPKLNKTPNEFIKVLMQRGMMMTINQRLEEETAQKIALDFGFELEVVDPLDLEPQTIEIDDPSKLKTRPPVVTVMGHVDHGKTSLLDALRKTNVMASEEGGITQRIGAYQVEIKNRKITFLDTPGHEAFTAMRARGTKITDVAILVVAADDGVMPQTLEAIDHAKAANVPIVVAVNKIDKPNANLDRVKQQLSDHALIPEEWGGNTVFVPVSAKQKTGLEELLEMILLVADLADLKANPDKFARGTVIEAKLDRGKGPVCTVLIQEGTFRVGDAFVAGNTYGRVRAFINDHGARIDEAPPSSPVEIIGLNEVPEAGDLLQVVADDRIARQIAEARVLHTRERTLASLKRITLDDLYRQIKQGEIKDLNLILKADGQGSVEALKDSLERLTTDEIRVRVIHTGVGTITESDVMLASASNAIIIGYNIRPEPHIKNLAEREKVDLRLYRVIYQAIEDITQAMVGMRKPMTRESVSGRAEVLQTFKISKVGTIAGCRVTDGKITRDVTVRVIRDTSVIYEGKLSSLKRFKDDAKEVAAGFECGMGIEKFNDIKVGDIFEAYVIEEIPHTTLAPIDAQRGRPQVERKGDALRDPPTGSAGKSEG